MLGVAAVMHGADDIQFNSEHLIMLYTGPTSHTGTKCMDFDKIFNVLLELSFVYFDGCRTFRM